MSEQNTNTRKDLGPVTAYAMAVLGGFSGTQAEFNQFLADSATSRYMDFYIDEDGYLVYRHTKNITDVTFELQEGVLTAVWPNRITGQ